MGKMKRLRVLGFFGFVYAVMVIALIYFLFMNTGLIIEKKSLGERNALELVVGNESFHIINNVELSYINDAGKKMGIGSIDSLLPNETQGFEFEIPMDATGSIKLLAEAPYHAVLRDVVVFGSMRGFELAHTLSAQDLVILGRTFGAALEICNKSSETVDAVVKEDHGDGFFAEIGSETAVSIEGKQCKQLNYTLNTIKAGSAEITFTITAGGTGKTITKTVEIIE